MSTWLSYTTALTMLLHAAFGCCWHHAHACATDVCDGHQRAAHGEGHAHDHHHRCKHSPQPPVAQHSHSPGQEQTPHRHRCEEDVCVFVRSNDIQQREFPESRSIDSLAIAVTRIESCDAVGCSRFAVDRFRATGPPLRTHLLYQILLI